MCLLSISCAAQRGVLILNQDRRIDTLMMKQRQIHDNDSTIDGFRVQIFMELGNDALKHADSVKTVFSEKYPFAPDLSVLVKVMVRGSNKQLRMSARIVIGLLTYHMVNQEHHYLRRFQLCLV